MCDLKFLEKLLFFHFPLNLQDFFQKISKNNHQVVKIRHQVFFKIITN